MTLVEFKIDYFQVKDIMQARFSVNFPKTCIYCDKKAEVHEDLEVIKSFGRFSEGMTKEFENTLKIPFCKKHLRDSNVIEKFREILRILIALILISPAILFLYNALFNSDLFQQELWYYALFFSLVFFVILVGIGIGLSFPFTKLMFYILRIIPAIFNKSFLHFPSGLGTLGLKIKFSKNGETIYFTFSNLSYAVKFTKINRNKLKSIGVSDIMANYSLKYLLDNGHLPSKESVIEWNSRLNMLTEDEKIKYYEDMNALRKYLS